MPSVPREPKTNYRDLLKIFDYLNKEYFGGMVCGGIRWQYMPIAEYPCLGTCQMDERIVRINTIMADKRIPLWYLRYVVYHEMLHLHLGPLHYTDPKWSPHSDRFHSIEITYPEYHRAIEYEETKLPKIAKSWIKWRAWKREQKGKIKDG